MATHQGATAASNTPFIVSNNTSFPIDKVAEAAAGSVWFQLHPRQDLNESRDWLDRAQAAGCKAIVATIDQVAGLSGPHRAARLCTILIAFLRIVSGTNGSI